MKVAEYSGSTDDTGTLSISTITLVRLTMLLNKRQNSRAYLGPVYERNYFFESRSSHRKFLNNLPSILKQNFDMTVLAVKRKAHLMLTDLIN